MEAVVRGVSLPMLLQPSLLVDTAVRCPKVVHLDLAVPVVRLAYFNWFGLFPE